MAEFKEISKAKLVMAVMYSDKGVFSKVKGVLINKFGDIEFSSEEFDFDFTDYYEDEFGKPLKKQFIIFKKPINREELVNIRLYTQKLENDYRENNKRQINIDPGYITKDNLVVATLKEQAYKIYLGKGVFGHMIFMFKKDEVISFKHTFPDYLVMNDFFLSVRNDLKID